MKIPEFRTIAAMLVCGVAACLAGAQNAKPPACPPSSEPQTWSIA